MKIPMRGFVPIRHRNFRKVTFRPGLLDPLMSTNRSDRSSGAGKLEFKVAGTTNKLNQFTNCYFYDIFQTYLAGCGPLCFQ